MARSANLIYSKHYSIAATTSGTETANIVGVSTRGQLDGVIIRKTSGSATTIDIEVRLKAGNANEEYLVYKASSMSLPVQETSIAALFDTFNPSVDNDLVLYLDPSHNGDFAVRLDFKIQQ